MQWSLATLPGCWTTLMGCCQVGLGHQCQVVGCSICCLQALACPQGLLRARQGTCCNPKPCMPCALLSEHRVDHRATLSRSMDICLLPHCLHGVQAGIRFKLMPACVAALAGMVKETGEATSRYLHSVARGEGGNEKAEADRKAQTMAARGLKRVATMPKHSGAIRDMSTDLVCWLAGYPCVAVCIRWHYGVDDDWPLLACFLLRLTRCSRSGASECHSTATMTAHET